MRHHHQQFPPVSGINGDMVRKAENGYYEIIWEERLKGMGGGRGDVHA